MGGGGAEKRRGGRQVRRWWWDPMKRSTQPITGKPRFGHVLVTMREKKKSPLPLRLLMFQFIGHGWSNFPVSGVFIPCGTVIKDYDHNRFRKIKLKPH